MNIFTCDEDPILAARFLDDKRVVKMCLESAQIYCTNADNFGLETPYKPTHQNHPATLWVREDIRQFHWFITHMNALFDEYTYRYNKVHLSSVKIQSVDYPALRSMIPYPKLSASEHVTNWPSSVGGSIRACRNRLIDKWDNDVVQPTWTRRLVPYWYEETLLELGVN